jgi:pimeloyl-ACP methyl ester carboxylesterase
MTRDRDDTPAGSAGETPRHGAAVSPASLEASTRTSSGEGAEADGSAEKIRLELRMMGKESGIEPEKEAEIEPEKEAGQPVLFLHCLGADLRQFLPQQISLSNVKRTVACSLRGHGQSTAPSRPTVEAYRPARLAADVAALLRQQGLPRAHLVGHGLGGVVGLELLRSAPETLASLSLSGVSATYGRSLGQQAALRLGLWLGGAEAGIAMATGEPDGDGVGAREVELLEDMADRASPDAIRLILRALRRYDYRPELQATRIPIQILRAEQDTRINKRLGPTLETLADHPRFTLRDLPGCGHWANLEAPAAFTRALREFYHELGELPDAGLKPVTTPPKGPPPRARLSTLVFETS